MYTWKPTLSESNLDITDSRQCRPINDSNMLFVSSASNMQMKQTFAKKWTKRYKLPTFIWNPWVLLQSSRLENVVSKQAAC